MSKKIKDRIGATIIRDKKLLLVTGYEEEYFWTPGGKPDGDESHERALKRETSEELGIKLVGEITLYGLYEDKKEDGFDHMKNYYYLTDFEGSPTPKQEITRFSWVSKEDFLNGKLKVTSGTREFLIPKLIEDGLL